MTVQSLYGTIQGWIEGVQLMSVGSEYRFAIPTELAHADRGQGLKSVQGMLLFLTLNSSKSNRIKWVAYHLIGFFSCNVISIQRRRRLANEF